MRTAILLLAAVSSLSGATCFLTVAGLGGEAEYEQRFAGWAQEMDRTLRASAGVARMETLHGPSATRARLASALEELARQCTSSDALAVTLIGHGTFDGVDYKFNLHGPDVTAAELARWLDRVPAARQLVVNTTSASGGSLQVLSRENRIVVTATKSGTEKNATIFARYWAEALRDPSADTDKNEAISALEAFRYAQQKTAQFYKSQKRLATEHALLEDTDGGAGSQTPSPEDGRGRLAAAFTLVRFGAAQAAAADPAKQKLFMKKEDLEQQIDRLKYQKAALPEAEYRKQLTALLLELAKTQAAMDP